MKSLLENKPFQRPCRRTAGFVSLFTIEFLAGAALLAMFLAMFLPTYAAVRHVGGGALSATAAGLAAGLLLDLVFVAVPCVLVRILVWRDNRKRRADRV